MRRNHTLAVLAFLFTFVLVSKASIFNNHPRAAAIFGFGPKNSGSRDNRDGVRSKAIDPLPLATPPPASERYQSHFQQLQHQKPPPPPTSNERTLIKENNVTSNNSTRPVPPPSFQNTPTDSSWSYSTGSSGLGLVGNKPQPHWRAAKDQQGAQDRFGLIEYELEASIQREREIAARLQNATEALIGMQQREDLHIRQLDVLTERVMDVEAQMAQEHNQLLENQAVRSALELEITKLKGKIEELKERCLKSDETNKQLRSEQRKLLKKAEKANSVAEEWASRVEQHRLDEIYKAYENQKKQGRPLGLVGWFLGWHKSDDEDLDDLREDAKSTLLGALETERSNVEELESAVAALEQNNTVIALQIQSRDEIISELNERVAVFEEEKVVLKAALQQLRKDMLEEAPKTQKVIADLDEARLQIQQLESEIEAVRSDHKQSAETYERMISEKQDQIIQTEANVTMISEYVDKLEGRLADYALARRDIEKREQDCAEIEKRAQDVDRECVSLREQITRFESEHNELKSLLQEMVVDRTKLQGHVAILTSERNKAIDESANLQASIESMQNELTDLYHQRQQQAEQYEEQLIQLQQNQRQLYPQQNFVPPPPGHEVETRLREQERQVAQLVEENEILQKNEREVQATVLDLRKTLEDMTTSRKELEAQLSELQAGKAKLQMKLNDALEAQQQADIRLQEQAHIHRAQLAEANQGHEDSAENSIADDRTKLQKELEQMKLQADHKMNDEREKFMASLAEVNASKEAELTKVKLQLETKLNEEKERYESKLAEERQRAERMLSEGKQSSKDELKILLEEQRAKFEARLAEEKKNATAILAEEQAKSSEQVRMKMKEAQQNYEARLAEEKDRFQSMLANSEQKSAEKLRFEMEKMSERARTKEEEMLSKQQYLETQLLVEKERSEKSRKLNTTSSGEITGYPNHGAVLAKTIISPVSPTKKASPVVFPITSQNKSQIDLNNRIRSLNRTAMAKPLNSTALVNTAVNKSRPPSRKMPEKRKGFSRSFRKVFAQISGFHGFFSGKYDPVRVQKRRTSTGSTEKPVNRTHKPTNGTLTNQPRAFVVRPRVGNQTREKLQPEGRRPPRHQHSLEGKRPQGRAPHVDISPSTEGKRATVDQTKREFGKANSY